MNQNLSLVQIIGVVLGYIFFVVISLISSATLILFPQSINVDCSAWRTCWGMDKFLFFYIAYFIIQFLLYLLVVKIIKLSKLHFWVVTILMLLLSTTIISWILGFEMFGGLVSNSMI